METTVFNLTTSEAVTGLVTEAVTLVLSSSTEGILNHSEGYFDHTGGNHTEHHEEHHGISVVSWRYEYVATPLLVSLFAFVAGILKLGFHHASFLSSIIPESCLLIIVGTVMGVILYFSGAAEGMFLDPRSFILFLLPPIILEAAFSLNDRVFAQNIGTILVFAVAGTLLNFFLIGPCIYGLAKSGAMGPMDISFIESMLFASFIVAVDPVAVLAIFQEVGVNSVLYFMVFGESLLNDAVTIVLYNTVVELSAMETITASQVWLGVASFFTVSLGGLTIGIIIGILCSLITKKTRQVRVVEPLTILVMAYLSYLVAELFHWSGIISLIGCGLVQSQYAMENISRKSHTTVHYFIKMLSSACDAVIFMFLGLELVRSDHHWHTGFTLWALLLCLFIRFLSTFGLALIVNQVRQVPINIKEQMIMWYGGLRGAVCFALVNSLDNEFVHKNMFQTATLFIIMVTVFIQGMTIKPLVSKCHIDLKDEHDTNIWEELNIRVIDHVMDAVECLTDQYGENRVRTWLLNINDNYLRKWLQVDPHSNDEKLLDVYRQIKLREYQANVKSGITPIATMRAPPPVINIDMSLADPGMVEVRGMAGGMHSVVRNGSKGQLDMNNTKAIKRLFRETKRHGFMYDPDLVHEERTNLANVLRERHARTRRYSNYRMGTTDSPCRTSVLPRDLDEASNGRVEPVPRGDLHIEMSNLDSDNIVK